MGRRFLLRTLPRTFHRALLTGITLVLLATGGPTAVADDSCADSFTARLECLADEVSSKDDHHETRVTLDKPLGLTGEERRELAAELADHQTALDSGALVVEVPDDNATGEGGTLLLVLAGKQGRLVSRESVITPLDAGVADTVRRTRGCRKELCDLVQKKDVRGSGLVDQELAEELDPGDAGSGFVPEPVKWAVFALLLLLTGLLGLAVVRSGGPRERRKPGGAVPKPAGHPGAPYADADEPTRTRAPVGARSPSSLSTGRHRRAADSPGPGRRAVVRTALHPQGYVEVDRCLLRAVWADPAEPPPAPGDFVDVMDDATGRDPDVLLAFPPREGRRNSGEEHAQ